jgi:hypothetical protein
MVPSSERQVPSGATQAQLGGKRVLKENRAVELMEPVKMVLMETRQAML